VPNERILGIGKLKTFIWSQWADIKGNVKYAVLYLVFFGGGGAVLLAWLTSYIQEIRGAPLQDRLGYIILAVLIFCALILSAIFLYLVLLSDRSKRSTGLSAPPRLNHVPLELPKKAEPVVAPLQVDLQGDILELYIWHVSSLFPVDKAQVFLRARIVNRGLSEATITAFGLQIEIGDYRKGGDRTQIPPNLRIKREREGVFIGTAFDEFPLEPVLGVSPNSEIYKKGIPHEGWLAFEVYVHGSEEFPNAQFDLLLEDSLGGSHRIRRKAGVYRTAGQLVTASQSVVPNS
jgi:hypothetical protein